MDVEEIKVKLTLDTSDYKSGLKTVSSDIDTTTSKANNSISGVSDEVKRATGVVKQSISSAIGVSIPAFALYKNNIGTIKTKTHEISREIRRIIKEFGHVTPDKSINQLIKMKQKISEYREELDADGQAIFDYQLAILNFRNFIYSVIIAPIKNFLKKFFNWIKGGLSKIFQWIKSVASNFYDWFKGTLIGAPINFIANHISKLLTSIKGKFTKFFTWFGGTKVGKITKSITQLFTKVIQKFSKAFVASIKLSLTTIAAWVAAWIAGFVLLTKVTNQVTELGDSIDKGAQKMNMSTEQYQKWSYAMELCGSSIDELKEGYNQMSGQISQAVNGTEDSITAFDALGVSLYDANGNLRKTGDIFEDVVANLQSIENTTERSAAAQKLFGESTSKLNPLLNSEKGFLEDVIRTQRVLNANMSSEMIAASAKYQDAITTMKQAWQGLKNSIGQAFLPVLQKAVVWLTVAIAKMNIIIRTLFGLKSSSSSLDSATESATGFGSSLSKATDAAKELKRQTMGFDEMNIMQSSSADSADSYSIGTDALDGFSGSLLPEDALDDIEAFETKMESVKEKVQSWATGIGILGGALIMVLGALSLSVGWVLAGATLFGAGVAIGEAGGFDALGVSIDDLGNKCASWATALSLTVGLLLSIFGLCAGNFQLALEGMALAGIGITTAASGGGGKVGLWLRNFAREFETAWLVLSSWFIDDLTQCGKWIKEQATALWDWIVDLVESIAHWLRNFAREFETAWLVLSSWFIDDLKREYNNVKSWFANLPILQAIQNKWEGIKTWWNNSAKKVFTKSFWQEKLSVIKQAFKDGINNGIISPLESAINWIVSKLNTISFSFPSWVPGLGGKTWGIQLTPVSIPRLAAGGIATKSTIANIGEAGKEAVLPLDRNTEWMDTLADRIMARGNGNIIIKVGETELGRAAINGINGITRQTGSLPLQFV